jgi:hypothetical protein
MYAELKEKTEIKSGTRQLKAKVSLDVPIEVPKIKRSDLIPPKEGLGLQSRRL